MKELNIFAAEQTGGVSLAEVIEAYYDCRRNKRGTMNQLRFEFDYEHELIELWHEINEHRYKPRRSIAFIVDRPVKREIFAADFRDRVVHHLIARRVQPLLEQQFIDDSYSTRKEKGTLYGIRRVEQKIRDCSENYTRDCYVMKLDISGYFMSISKVLLYQCISRFLDPLDHLVTEEWGVEHYGRYVDDMVLVHPSKEHLLAVRQKIDRWLREHALVLHPRKMYLQHYSKGVCFVGGVIKPGRCYIARRTVGRLFSRIHCYNTLLERAPRVDSALVEPMVATMNSYLGMMRHYMARRLFRRVLQRVAPVWYQYTYFSCRDRRVKLVARQTYLFTNKNIA